MGDIRTWYCSLSLKKCDQISYVRLGDWNGMAISECGCFRGANGTSRIMNGNKWHSQCNHFEMAPTAIIEKKTFTIHNLWFPTSKLREFFAPGRVPDEKKMKTVIPSRNTITVEAIDDRRLWYLSCPCSIGTCAEHLRLRVSRPLSPAL